MPRVRALIVAALLASGCGASAPPPASRPPAAEDEASAQDLLSAARAAERDGDSELAEKRYRRGMRKKPSDAPIAERFVAFLIQQGRADQASKVAARFVDRNPGTPRGYHMLADAY